MGNHRSRCVICGERLYNLTFSRTYCSDAHREIAQERRNLAAYLKTGWQGWTVLYVPGDEYGLERGGTLSREIVKMCLFRGTFDTGTILLADGNRYVVGGEVDSQQYLTLDK